jgi:hypothetical protein
VVLPPCRRWRNATSRKLVLFSHRSASRIFIGQPGRIPSPVVTQDGDHQLLGGEKQAGLRPLPLPQLQGCSSSVLGRGVRRVGVGLRAGSGSLLPSVIGGKGVRRSWRWQLPRARLSGPSGFGAASGATFHRGSRKRFLRRRDSRCRLRTDLQLYGLLLLRRPSNVGGCSYLRSRNRSSVCNGTLSASVCSLWRSGPEHVCIFGTEPCFFLISSAKTRLSAS